MYTLSRLKLVYRHVFPCSVVEGPGQDIFLLSKIVVEGIAGCRKHEKVIKLKMLT